MNRKHFLNLHRRMPQHGGMVLCTFDPDFAGQAVRLDEALRSAGVLSGKVLRVNRPGT
jgi:hypothetical protein